MIAAYPPSPISIRMPIRHEYRYLIRVSLRKDLILWSALIIAGRLEPIVDGKWVIFHDTNALEFFARMVPCHIGGKAITSGFKVLLRQKTKEIREYYGENFLDDLKADLLAGGYLKTDY